MGDYEKFVEAFDAFIKSKDTNRSETLFQSIEHLDVDDFFLYNIKASMLNKRGDLKEAKENIEKSISLIDKTIANMPISNRYSLFKEDGNFQNEVYSNNIKVLIKDTYITGAEIYAKLEDYDNSLCCYKKAQYYMSFIKSDFNDDFINLFSFRKFNQYTLADLIESKITVSPSTVMNDPFDSLINLWATEEHLAMMCKEKNHAKPYAKSFQYNRIRCFCYGTEEKVVNKTLMWAHYAEEHRGICIKYRLSSHFIKQEENDKYEHMYLKKVEYTDKPIDIEIKTINSAIGFATKSKEWSYENEVRLIDYNPNIETPYYGIALDADSCIESIYFGFRCENSTINTIKALFKYKTDTPKFYKMELDKNNVYQMICREI